MTVACDICYADFGAGEWDAFLIDKATGAELPLERTGWRGSAGRAANVVTDGSVVLDPEYALWLGRRPRLWVEELAFRRDGALAWIGPVTSIDDQSTDEVVWNAQDRMVFASERRWWWRTMTFAGESTRLFEAILDSADFGDPTGLMRDARPNGVVTSLSVTAGDKLRDSLDQLAGTLEWAVIGETIRYGAINISAERTLPEDAWGDNRPAITADGFQRLTHVCAVTTNNGRVFYPSESPYDRPPESPLLVDTIDVGNVTAPEAARMARQLWLARQGEMFIDPAGGERLTANFPLSWTELVPGATMTSTVQGAALFAQDAPVRLDSVTFDLADGQEVGVGGSLSEVPAFDPGQYSEINDYANLPGLILPVLPDGSVFQFPSDLSFDWGSFEVDIPDIPDIGGIIGPDPGFQPVDIPIFDPGFDFSAYDPQFPNSLFEFGVDGLGGTPATDLSACPPAYCCAVCGSVGAAAACAATVEQYYSGTLTKLTAATSEADLLLGNLSLSPDGRRLLYAEADWDGYAASSYGAEFDMLCNELDIGAGKSVRGSYHYYRVTQSRLFWDIWCDWASNTPMFCTQYSPEPSGIPEIDVSGNAVYIRGMDGSTDRVLTGNPAGGLGRTSVTSCWDPWSQQMVVLGTGPFSTALGSGWLHRKRGGDAAYVSSFDLPPTGAGTVTSQGMLGPISPTGRIGMLFTSASKAKGLYILEPDYSLTAVTGSGIGGGTGLQLCHGGSIPLHWMTDGSLLIYTASGLGWRRHPDGTLERMNCLDGMITTGWRQFRVQSSPTAGTTFVATIYAGSESPDSATVRMYSVRG